MIRARLTLLLPVCGAVLALTFSDPRQHCLAGEPPIGKNADTSRVKKPAGQELDDALLNDLDNELLEGAGDLKNRPKGKPVESGPADDVPPPMPAEGEDVGAPGEEGDPLVRIGQQMRRVEQLISKRTQRTDSEQTQQRIVAELAKLIDEAQKQSAAQQSSAQSKKSQKTGKRQMVQQPATSKPGNNSNKPTKDSTDRLGKAENAQTNLEARKGNLLAILGL